MSFTPEYILTQIFENENNYLDIFNIEYYNENVKMIFNIEYIFGGEWMKIKLDTKKIYLTMAEHGITASEIARQGGVSQQAVSNALNGSRIGKMKVVPAICQALGLSAKDIVIIED